MSEEYMSNEVVVGPQVPKGDPDGELQCTGEVEVDEDKVKHTQVDDVFYMEGDRTVLRFCGVDTDISLPSGEARRLAASLLGPADKCWTDARDPGPAALVKTANERDAAVERWRVVEAQLIERDKRNASLELTDDQLRELERAWGMEARRDLPASSFKEEVSSQLRRIHAMLVAKNEAYGDSALNPIRVFSRAPMVEQLKVRIDDKLSRMARGSGEETEDVELDLVGYLVLLMVARARVGSAP